MRNLLRVSRSANSNLHFFPLLEKFFTGASFTFSACGRLKLFPHKKSRRRGGEFACCHFHFRQEKDFFQDRKKHARSSSDSCKIPRESLQSANHRDFAASFRCQLPLQYLHPTIYDPECLARYAASISGHGCLCSGAFSFSNRSTSNALGVWREASTSGPAEWRTREPCSLSWCATAHSGNTRVEKAGHYYDCGFAR